MRKLAMVAAATTCISISCAESEGGGSGSQTSNEKGGPGREGETQSGTVPNPAGGGGTEPPPGGSPAKGSVEVLLSADQGASGPATVSLGVPFSQSSLKDETTLLLKDESGKPVTLSASVLARWPADGSIRSVLVAFKTTLAAGAQQKWKLEYGGSPGTLGPKLDPNPDGPVAARLPADWYAASHVSGYTLPASKNKRFANYDKDLEARFAAVDFGSYAVSCGSTTNHRTYYDGPHARYQRFVRNATAASYRDARSEANWYREHEVTWVQGRSMTIQTCQGSGWTPQTPLDQNVLRMMAAQGNPDDYLLTGDPAARELVLAFGEAYRQNIPALAAGGDTSQLTRTERNLGWTLMGLSSYFALDSSAKVKTGLVDIVDRVVAWQNRGTSGALEHDVNRADPSECEDGPKGASPFMTSLVVDGLMDYWLLTQDTAKVEPVVRKLAEWYETKAVTSDGLAFRYLWNCATDPYDDSGTADLNLLIGHVFGAAYLLTKKTSWLTFGDKMADSGVDNLYASRPKQWDQAARSFGKYLGYRALALIP